MEDRRIASLAEVITPWIQVFGPINQFGPDYLYRLIKEGGQLTIKFVGEEIFVSFNDNALQEKIKALEETIEETKEDRDYLYRGYKKLLAETEL